MRLVSRALVQQIELIYSSGYRTETHRFHTIAIVRRNCSAYRDWFRKFGIPAPVFGEDAGSIEYFDALLDVLYWTHQIMASAIVWSGHKNCIGIGAGDYDVTLHCSFMLLFTKVLL